MEADQARVQEEDRLSSEGDAGGSVEYEEKGNCRCTCAPPVCVVCMWVCVLVV